MIGSLPNLRALKLLSNSVIGPEWDPVEGEFVGLKYLEIEFCDDLMYWNADSSHFPVLEKLVLKGLSELDDIPLGIGEIPTLLEFICAVAVSQLPSQRWRYWRNNLWHWGMKIFEFELISRMRVWRGSRKRWSNSSASLAAICIFILHLFYFIFFLLICFSFRMVCKYFSSYCLLNFNFTA
ncbi:hypothetical protein ABFX02_04G166600 [Erythranthe guttata]